MKVGILVVAFACAVSACGDSLGRVDAAACGCHMEGAVLTMTWGCFCEKFACDWTLTPTRPACAGQQRIDYPECGLTWITPRPVGVFGPGEWVFDSSGHLVGETVVSDTSSYTCPSDPALEGSTVRSGRYPEPSCRAIVCDDPCYTGSFPCPSPDGGARD